MGSVVKNGQPSMEEILASIRRIVADDAGGPAPLIDLNRKNIERPVGLAGTESRVDDSVDFELPSMFRAGQNANQRNGRGAGLKQNGKAPIGRLTDAIRNVAPKVATPVRQTSLGQAEQNAPQTPDAARSVTQPDAQFGIRPKAGQSLSSLTAEPKPTDMNSHGVGTMITENGADTGQLSNADYQPRSDERAPEAHPAATQPQTVTQQPSPQPASASPTMQSQSSPKPNAAKPRVMAPFRDTRMNRMSGPSAPAQQADGGNPAATTTHQGLLSAASAKIGAIVPGALDLPGRQPDAAPPADTVAQQNQANDHGAAVNAAAHQPEVQPSNPHAVAGSQQGEPNPPPIPDEGPAGAPAKIEDATADLLRPMLRQWLSDNMPRMVEKALHIEVAESVRTGKPDEDV